MATNEYFDGNAELAAQLGCTKDSGELSRCPKGITYVFPPENEDSWFIDIHPKPGLFVSDAYFMLYQPVARTYEIEQPGLFLCSVESGDVTLFERGKKARQMRQGIHLLVNQGKPFKVVFGNEKHIRYTGVWVFADFISKYLQDREWKESLTINDALTWPSHYYNTPELLLHFQQLRFAIRGGVTPLMYFESKVIAILSLILCAVQTPKHAEWFQKKERPKHVTYQNQQFIWKVKAELDKEILNPPPVKQLATIAGMGTTKLRILFKSCYGMSIADYVRREKMNYALRLLWHDEMSIQNISSLLGYARPSKFTEAFKKIHGLTPRQVRQSFNL
jgi:AraC-like DNA-binding protein